jgi:hypothetical protein
MATEETNAVAPTTPAPSILAEPKNKPAAPVLDSNRPLTQQVDKILAQLPKEKEDVKPKADAPEETPKEPEAPEQEEVLATPSDKSETVEEEDFQEPVELPPWQQYIIDNLPDIRTVGHEEGKKDKVYTVKRLEDLPEDFEFSDKRTEMSFSQALASQELNARDLLTKYNGEQQQQQYQDLKNKEAVDVRADIQSLQKEGLLEKFKYEDDDPKFNEDPAVKVANEIYDVMDKTNMAYAQKGLSYRVGYADAADKYFARQTRVKPPAPTPKPSQQREREEVAKKISAPQGEAPGTNRKHLPAGASMQDVLRAYKAGVI